MTTTRLPLFPLHAVLFPGLVMPLNVFEPRYRALVSDLLRMPEDGPRPFGVVAIREGYEVAPPGRGLPGEPGAGVSDVRPGAGFAADPMDSFHPIGCVADATTIRPRDPVGGSGGAGDGGDEGTGPRSFEVLATGTTRFRLLSVETVGRYLVGEVELLEEDAGEGAEVLATGVLRAFRAYQQRLASAYERSLVPGSELPEEPSVVSYLVAAATVLDTTEKQALLEAPDTAARLARELRMLRREIGVIGKLPSVPAVELTRRPTNPN
ncbi:LON peptidase substrate-binding domain-containing protein [Streptomyces sp. ST2-7A]|uniref:LON peptidase substrate-binding domain-containing protein n=1 Tax=Streptomyces sp. ST2-7A TaxID=2907214 RepID=UPI001F36FE75|nr:LON peptidase substrate-binding domain-containing protein [Streptomyces sp. ST2-7A]MCE7082005.1 LON peptidase substrate-binding domain-containing protein [Streptomyces sp. ST2-7A]